MLHSAHAAPIWASPLGISGTTGIRGTSGDCRKLLGIPRTTEDLRTTEDSGTRDGDEGMGQPGLSAEQIIRQHIEPAVKAAGGALQAAQSTNPGDPTVALALVSLGLLEHFLNRIVARLADQEVAERVAVYQVVTEACVKSLGYPASDVFAAVLRLCGEQDQGLTGDLP